MATTKGSPVSEPAFAEQAPAYDRLKDEVGAAFGRRDLLAARGLAQQLVALAEAQGDAERIDRAAVSLAAIQVELGEPRRQAQRLRQILLRSADPELRYLAAYTLARAYDVDRDSEKSLFYARMAQRYALENAQPEQLSASHNLLGNLLISRSDFEAAHHEFGLALANMPQTDSLRLAAILDNLGYCYAVRGRLPKAFRHLFRSVRLAVRLGAPSQETSSRLSLAYTYLQAGRIREAQRHARRALAMAEEAGEREMIKYGLFLVGEGEKQGGNPLSARFYFARLQDEYYPEVPDVCDLLLLLDVQNLVNLRA
jgi:tetratricopeptide (TPR) repeat protein